MIRVDYFDYEFLPARRKSKKLMIVLHGRGDSLSPFKSFDEELNIPEMNYLLLNAPRKYMSGYTWYAEPPYQGAAVMKMRQRLIELVEDLELQGWKSENIFLLGFSQGCLMSADLALHYPKKFAGLVGISGYFHFFPRWRNLLKTKSKNTPWLMTHGFKDDILKIEDTRYGVSKLKDAGLKIDWVEMDKKHTFEEEEYPLIRRWVREKFS